MRLSKLAETGTTITFEADDSRLPSGERIGSTEVNATLAELQQRQQQLQAELDALGDQIEHYARMQENDR